MLVLGPGHSSSTLQVFSERLVASGLDYTLAEWCARTGENPATYPPGVTFLDGVTKAHGWNQKHDPRFGMCVEAQT